MTGETNLHKLLATMQPQLQEGEYVFCTLPHRQPIDFSIVIAFFREAEGNTIVIPRGHADKLGLAYSYVASWITLTIHSSLDAVGLTAAFSAALGNAGISCNVWAAFYHDHIFVAEKDAAKAIQILNDLSAKHREN